MHISKQNISDGLDALHVCIYRSMMIKIALIRRLQNIALEDRCHPQTVPDAESTVICYNPNSIIRYYGSPVLIEFDINWFFLSFIIANKVF